MTKVIVDGAYDSRNFMFLANNCIELVIKVKRNTSLKAGECMPRKLSVIE